MNLIPSEEGGTLNYIVRHCLKEQSKEQTYPYIHKQDPPPLFLWQRRKRGHFEIRQNILSLTRSSLRRIFLLPNWPGDGRGPEITDCGSLLITCGWVGTEKHVGSFSPEHKLTKSSRPNHRLESTTLLRDYLTMVPFTCGIHPAIKKKKKNHMWMEIPEKQLCLPVSRKGVFVSAGTWLAA